jgi:hypothetical protein
MYLALQTTVDNVQRNILSAEKRGRLQQRMPPLGGADMGWVTVPGREADPATCRKYFDKSNMTE